MTPGEESIAMEKPYQSLKEHPDGEPFLQN